MKKYFALLIALACAALFFTACEKSLPSPGGSGPSDPVAAEQPASERTEKAGADRIPMVMVDGALYYDTGRESGDRLRCGVMDGKITSSVDAAEIPKDNDQSNFGSGYEYQYAAEGSIDININGRWFVFERRSGDGSVQSIVK